MQMIVKLLENICSVLTFIFIIDIFFFFFRSSGILISYMVGYKFSLSFFLIICFFIVMDKRNSAYEFQKYLYIFLCKTFFVFICTQT